MSLKPPFLRWLCMPPCTPPKSSYSLPIAVGWMNKGETITPRRRIGLSSRFKIYVAVANACSSHVGETSSYGLLTVV